MSSKIIMLTEEEIDLILVCLSDYLEGEDLEDETREKMSNLVDKLGEEKNHG